MAGDDALERGLAKAASVKISNKERIVARSLIIIFAQFKQSRMITCLRLDFKRSSPPTWKERHGLCRAVPGDETIRGLARLRRGGEDGALARLAQASLGRYIDQVYNARRPRSSLDRQTPDEAHFNAPPSIPMAAGPRQESTSLQCDHLPPVVGVLRNSIANASAQRFSPMSPADCLKRALPSLSGKASQLGALGEHSEVRFRHFCGRSIAIEYPPTAS